jgi:hypothetical protein
MLNRRLSKSLKGTADFEDSDGHWRLFLIHMGGLRRVEGDGTECIDLALDALQVCMRIILAERPQLVGEVIGNFCG